MKFCPLCASSLELNLLSTDDRERMVCVSETCEFIHYDNPVPVVAAVVEYQGKILLAHNVLWPPNWYALITGFLERDESPEQGVLRELKEETNLDASEASLIGVYPFARMNQVIIAYHVKATGEVRLNEELDDYKLFEKEKVRYWGAGTGYALRDFIRSELPGHEPGQIQF
jgi:NAD+ diphosphatase